MQNVLKTKTVFIVKKNKKYLIILTFILVHFFIINELKAQQEEKIFLSLRNNEVNVRQGPDWNYPIKFVYKKKYLPVILIDSYEIWRKVKDYENNSGWIHVSKLSKRKTGINIKNQSILFSNPTVYSKPIAKLDKGRLILIKKCNKKWCKISTSKFVGWIKKEFIWGRT